MPPEKWPGSGTAHIGYGVPGGVSLDKHSEPLVAHEHIIGGFVNAGTVSLFEPVAPAPQFGEHSNRRISSLRAFANSTDIGGVDFGILKPLAYESQILTSPAIIDPLIGRRISLVSPQSLICAYADDFYVSFFDASRKDELKSRINMRSQILQVDRHGLVRTRRGLAIVSDAGAVDYIVNGNFMHASSISSDTRATSIVASSASGMMRLYDTASGKCKWEQQRPKGSLGGWSRLAGGIGGSPDIALWCNRHELATIDFREPPSAQKGESRADSHTVLAFEDRQRYIRDLDSGVDGSDAFALTSYDMVWVTDQGRSRALSVEHAIATSDTSTCLYKGTHKDRSLVTITSQLMPTTFANVFGLTDGLPTLLDDTYFIDSWPTIIPQSHITLETSAGASLYSVGAHGGLYKQQWNETKLGEYLDDKIDVPEPDEARPVDVKKIKAICEDKMNRKKPFDLLNSWTSSYVYNFEKLYDYAFEPLGPELDDSLTDVSLGAAMGPLDLPDLASFIDHCSRAWIAPLKQKAKLNPTSVSEEAVVQRKRSVNKIVSDMRDVAEKYEKAVDAWKTPSATFTDDVQSVLGEWSDDESESVEPESSQGVYSQPTQLPTGPSLMSSEADGPLSQPVPTLRPVSKWKHKHRHKKSRKRASLTQ